MQSDAPETFPIPAENLTNLIGEIYDCVVDPGLWPKAMAQICDELHFSGSGMGLIRLGDGSTILSASTGYEGDFGERLKRNMPDLFELWGGREQIINVLRDEPIVLSRLNPGALHGAHLARLRRTFSPSFIDGVSALLMRDAHAFGMIGFDRPEDAGPVSTRELACLRLLIPHLRRAAAITRLLDVKDLAAATFADVLDGLKAPVLLVDASLGIRHANAAAGILLERCDPLLASGGNLITRSAAATRALSKAITQAEIDESALGWKGMGIPLRTAEGDSYAMYVMPLRQSRRRSDILPIATAAVVIGGPAASSTRAEGVIAGLFSLTPAETRVFDHMVAGHSPSEVAHILGIGQSTVRTHMLRLFDKLGVHRQADLVAMGRAFASPFEL